MKSRENSSRLKHCYRLQVIKIEGHAAVNLFLVGD